MMCNLDIAKRGGLVQIFAAPCIAVPYFKGLAECTIIRRKANISILDNNHGLYQNILVDIPALETNSDHEES